MAHHPNADHPDTILVIDFGSQYTQLIARRVRELNVYAEIVPFQNITADSFTPQLKGIILSGSPASVTQADSPQLDLALLPRELPVLGVCFGAQYLTQKLGGRVEASNVREYGRADLKREEKDHPLLKSVPENSTVWMSHSDTILELAPDDHIIARTGDGVLAAFGDASGKRLGLQFHPEVTHTEYGKQILKNFVADICACNCDWTPAAFVDHALSELKTQLGDTAEVVCALSGGVDSTVAAMLVHRAIGARLHCVFVDNGLLRDREFEEVLEAYKDLGLNITGVRAADQFYTALKGITDPEEKRKRIGATFIEVFEQEAEKIGQIDYLVQGTIYPDIIESAKVGSSAVTIKSHHNVGGLPERMRMQVVEPLKELFKDEVRRVGAELEIPQAILGRHPFPGPGLGIRILGEVGPDRIHILQKADRIYIDALHEFGLYDKTWQRVFGAAAGVLSGRYGRRTYLRKRAVPARCNQPGRHDSRLGAPATRVSGHRVQPHHQPREGRKPRGLRHQLQASGHHRMGISGSHPDASEGPEGNLAGFLSPTPLWGTFGV